MSAPSANPDRDAAAPGSMPRRLGGLLQTDLGDERVAYDPERRHSFRLNRTAGLVLDRCDGQSPMVDVVAELADAFAVDRDQVATQLSRALATFVADGLVDDPNGGSQALAGELDRAWGPPPPPVGSTAAPAPAGHASASEHDVEQGVEATGPAGGGWRRVLDLSVCFTADNPALAAELDRVFGSLPVDPAPDRTPRARRRHYHLSRTASGSIQIQLAARPVGGANTADGALSFTQWHLNREAVAGVVDRVLLHAGAVRLADGGLVVMPGQSNAGKSTLVAGLVRAGRGYVTDELIALAPGTALATGYRKAISLDPGSWSLFPEVELSTAEARREWLVEPSRLHPAALEGDDTGPVSLVVFPGFREGSATEAEWMSPGQALVELIRHDPAGQPLDSAAFATLADLARRTPAFRLTMGGLEPAVAQVLALAGRAQVTGSDS